MPIATPSLTITDLADGTGCTVTVAGAEGGSSNVVAYQRVNGELGSAIWTTAATVTGNGSGSVALAKGWYWWRCVSSLAGEMALANLVYQPITSGLDAIYHQLIDTAEARIKLLNLPQIEHRVFGRMATPKSVADLPGVMLTIDGNSEQSQGGTNARDDIGYPIDCVILRTSPMDDDSIRGWLLYCRERIARAFRQQRVPGIEPIWMSDVQYGASVQSNMPQYMYLASALRFTFTAREPRGFGV